MERRTKSVSVKKRTMTVGAFGLVVAGFFIGALMGGYLFRNTEPRSLLAVNRCSEYCLTSSEVIGLAASVGIQEFPSLLPSIVFETDKTLVFKHPFPGTRIHYLIVPKKDIKNDSELSEDDRAYLVDAYAVMGKIVRDEGLEEYKMYTNGPGYQKVAYLHFHLVAE